ncbi:MAG: histidine kinase [Clostridiaceae bacterium]|nr:histidine kinase [Clostridiaceae bacterium]
MKRKSIRYNLMVTYSLIILIPFLVLSMYFIITESSKINDRTFAALRQNCISLNEAMEREIWQMNLVSLNIAYSQLIKDAYGDYLSDQGDYESLKAINSLLANSIGPNRLVDQANLYSINGTVIASGLNNEIYNYSVDNLSWYQAAENHDGGRVLTYEGSDPKISKYTTDEFGKLFLSLSRKYFDKYNNSLGFIEVKKSLKQVLSQVTSYKSVVGEHIYIFDSNGSLIHSTDRNEVLSQSVYEQIAQSTRENDFADIKYKNSTYYSTYTISDDSFMTAIVIDESSLFMPTRSYIRNVILMAVLSLALALGLSYIAANRITVPIQHIYHEMKNISLEGYSEKKDINTNAVELNMLYERFIDMQHKLVDSLNKQLLLKNQEMQSKMLALQSQMNPHFLYNSIATIQSMAYENMNGEIVSMCQSMSNILRYISSDSDATVDLEAEITNTMDFLACMTSRYEDELFYTVDIPESMNHIRVPKLCIQPLVENSIRYCSTKMPPWHINIRGIINEGQYEIIVSDNGPGFSEQALSTINNKIREIDETGLLPSLEITGMGLLNVYLRFKILHDKKSIFIVENNDDIGASVTIGGSCDSRLN